MTNQSSLSFCHVFMPRLQEDAPPRLNWSICPPHPVLGPDEVHLWLGDADQAAWQPATRQHVLSDEEKARAARFRFDRDRDRFIVRHALLREIIAQYLSLEPARIQLAVNARGKPELMGDASMRELQFNLSTSGPVVLYGFTRRRQIGIDVEQVRREVNWMEIAAEFFHPEEVRCLRGSPEAGREELFFAHWTMKEAFVKARGLGLQRPLLETDFTAIVRQGRGVLTDADGSAWLCASLRPGNHLLGALVLQS